MMNLAGLITAIVIPRIIIIILHFAGRLIKIRKGGHQRWMKNSGLIIMIIIAAIITSNTLYGRLNFKTEEVTIKIKGLNKDLDGLKIVQLSDLHLPGFYKYRKVLQKVMFDVSSLKPDLILNTGDFIDY